jgi:hypothetical protein
VGKISQYAVNGTPSISDKLIGTEVTNSNETKNYTIGDILSLPLPNVPVYANNAAALTGGLVAGNVYRITGTDYLGVVH